MNFKNLTFSLMAIGLAMGMAACRHHNDAEFYYMRGLERMEAQQVNDAILDLRKATELDDSKVDYFTALGDAYFMNGDMGNSFSALQKALKLDSKNVEALLKMGEITFYSKDYDRSLETLSKVTSLDKNNRTAFLMKAFIYKEMGDTTNAVQLFRHVIELYPDYAPAYEELGLIYANARNILGEEYLTTAVELDPQNTNTLYALAMFYQEMEQPEKADETYLRILAIDPQNSMAWNNRGWLVMLYSEEYDTAIAYFTKAIDADNQCAEAFRNRAFSYEQKGDIANANRDYETARQIDPSLK